MSFRKQLRHYLIRAVLFGAGLLFFGVLLASSAWLYIKQVIQVEVVTVPELIGLPLDQARAVVEGLDLAFRIDEDAAVHSDVIARDRVFLQIPRAGRKIKTGRKVEVTLSAGPEKQLVPPLRGETLSFSKTLMKQAEFQAGVISRTPSPLAEKGKVLSQTPGGGEEIGLKTGISLLVSEGPQMPWYVTPNFVGREYQTVIAFLDRHGFRVVTKYNEADPDLGQIVLQQIPRAGFPVNVSQNITLVVNKDY